MIATIESATLTGVEGRPVAVEVHVSNGLPCFTVVGLPDAACRESRDRVRAALLSSGLPWPLRRVTVNLAPSGVRKGGAGLDLPVAIGLLVACGEIDPPAVAGAAFLGELGLDGSLRPVPGVLPLVDAVRADAVVVPPAGVREAQLVGRHAVRSARTLREVVEALTGRGAWPDPDDLAGRAAGAGADSPAVGEMADVQGQQLGRRAVEIAAAGAHHLLLCGPPGSGKTMLARRLPDVLPPLARDEALEVSRVRSAAGLPLAGDALCARPPFRSPHHCASAVSLVGGGAPQMRPGEISLASNGVLFLDELGEFPASVLDALRQPLEEGVVHVARARATCTFPARFLLVGATNPCPCGEGGVPGACRCSPSARDRYARRLSGPLLDRFDLRVRVARPTPAELLDRRVHEATIDVAARVLRARAIARRRGVRANAELPSGSLDRFAPLAPGARDVLERRLACGSLTARGLDRLRRVARTIADLDAAGAGGDPPLRIERQHLLEALELRVAPHLLLGAEDE